MEEHACGVLIKQGDAEGLVSALRAMERDRASAVRMGDSARRALGEVYDRENACEQWRELLESVVTGTNKSAAAHAEHARG